MNKPIFLGTFILILIVLSLEVTAANPGVRANVDTFSTPLGNGYATQGSPNVFINGIPAVRKTDAIYHPTGPCGVLGSIIGPGSSTVLINGISAIRVGDSVQGYWSYTDPYGCYPVYFTSQFSIGSPNVFIG